jgi:hypothetical protein
MALKDIRTPVDPDVFVKEFSKKFQKWGHAITNGLKETWKQNCLAMNNGIAFKNDVKKFVVSAPTGSAKTENVITYCSMLPKDIKVVISTNLTAEADRLASDINKEASDNRACAYHSKNKVTIQDASKFQIMVTTHVFYKNHNKSLKKWSNAVGDRDLVIIDEALTTIQEVSLNINEVTIAFNFFEALRRDKTFSKFKFPPIFCEDEENPYVEDNALVYETELISLFSELSKITQILDGTRSGTYLERSNTMIDIADEDDPPVLVKSFTI